MNLQDLKTLTIDVVCNAGYVLDFSDEEFNNFTRRSIGEPLKIYYNNGDYLKKSATKWGQLKPNSNSKAKCLRMFFGDNKFSEKHVKLVKDLLEEYIRQNGEAGERIDEVQNALAFIYKKCDLPTNITHTKAEELSKKIDSPYIRNQISQLAKDCSADPSSALARARSLIESCFKYVLNKNNIEYNNDKFGDLRHKAMNCLDIDIKSAKANGPEDFMKIISAINTISDSVVHLRNEKSNAHGKGFDFKAVEPIYATFATGVVCSLCEFIVDLCEKDYKTQVDDDSSSDL